MGKSKGKKKISPEPQAPATKMEVQDIAGPSKEPQDSEEESDQDFYDDDPPPPSRREQDQLRMICSLKKQMGEMFKERANMMNLIKSLKNQVSELCQDAGKRATPVVSQAQSATQTVPLETAVAAALPADKPTPKRKKTSDTSSDDETTPRAKKAETVTATPAAPLSAEPARTRPAPPKIPAIIVRNKENWPATCELLRREKLAYVKAKLVNDGVAVTPATVDDHRKMTKSFTQHGVEYHTYSLAEERLLRVVIRGIPVGITDEEIKSEIVEQGFAPSSVQRMISRRTKLPMPLVLVQLPQTQRTILDLKNCCLLTVRVEEQRSTKVPTQCHRCQRFGHGQSRCTAAPKCVKCGALHLSRDCMKTREEPACCANCQGNHPASYRGCPRFPKLPGRQGDQPERRTTRREGIPPSRQVTAPVTTRVESYAAAVRPKQAETGVVLGPQDIAALAAMATMVPEMLKNVNQIFNDLQIMFQHYKPPTAGPPESN